MNNTNTAHMPMRKGGLACVSAALLLAAAPAHARLGTPDLVAANTLLLPHFEVDLEDPNGANTTVSIYNNDATAVMVRASLWTDMGVLVSTFHTYLTGYDATELDLRMVLVHGEPPESATAGQDPTNRISPQGPFSQDINFASCTNNQGSTYPSQTQDRFGLPPQTFSAQRQEHIRAALTGKPSERWGGRCGARDHGDNVARGYVTLTTDVACNGAEVGDPGWYRTDQSMLTGQFTLVRRAGLAFSAPLVHLETSLQGDTRTINGTLGTFNARLFSGPPQDGVEPLPSLWSARFVQGSTAAFGPLSGASTTLVVWRDPGVRTEPFTCGSDPAVFPLRNGPITVFDETENVQELAAGTRFPLVSNVVPLEDLGVPFNSGFLQFNLAHGTRVLGGHVMALMEGPQGGAVVLPASPMGFATGAVRITPDRVVLAKGGDTLVEVSLVANPTADVTFSLTSSDPTMAEVFAAGGGPPTFVLSAGAPSAMVRIRARADAPNMQSIGFAGISATPTQSTDAAFAGHQLPTVMVLVPARGFGALTVPASVTEGSTFQVQGSSGLDIQCPRARNGAPCSTQIHLRSSDETLAPSVAQLQYPYSQLNITVRTVDNMTVDGSRTLTITPVLRSEDDALDGLELNPLTVTVNDND